jgi:hypothetical protein
VPVSLSCPKSQFRGVRRITPDKRACGKSATNTFKATVAWN